MEEMNNQVMENGAIEIVEEVTDKLTFSENLAAYGLATVFGLGVLTTGYLGYKGIKAITNKVKKNIKGKMSDESDEEIVDSENEEIHEIVNDETEE